MKKSIDWQDLPRESRLGRVMWPHLASQDDQRDMAYWTAIHGKKSPMQARKEQQQIEQRRKKW
jgi:hypothetical protein